MRRILGATAVAAAVVGAVANLSYGLPWQAPNGGYAGISVGNCTTFDVGIQVSPTVRPFVDEC